MKRVICSSLLHRFVREGECMSVELIPESSILIAI